MHFPIIVSSSHQLALESELDRHRVFYKVGSLCYYRHTNTYMHAKVIQVHLLAIYIVKFIRNYYDQSWIFKSFRESATDAIFICDSLGDSRNHLRITGIDGLARPVIL